MFVGSDHIGDKDSKYTGFEDSNHTGDEDSDDTSEDDSDNMSDKDLGRASKHVSTMPVTFDQCIYFSRADAARALIQNGEVEGCDRDAIFAIGRYGSGRVLRMMLDLGMCRAYEEAPRRRDRSSDKVPMTRYEEEKDSPMTIATKRGHINIMELLPDIRGVSLHERNEKGCMPIQHAASNPRTKFRKVFQELLKLNTDINARDDADMTPIMHMANTGNLMLQAGNCSKQILLILYSEMRPVTRFYFTFCLAT